ncbi:MAG: sugar phosphate nucleotidyltransferase [bacterium]
MKHVYFGILAGGSGERLWPLSKKDSPKQLLPFLGDSSLLQLTIQRIKLLTNHKENIFVITNQEQEALIKKNVGNSIGFVLAEPCARNTAPAILWAATKIYQKDPVAIIVFLTADHFVPEPEKLNVVLRKAITYVTKHKKIALFGLTPTHAATGYGYIQAAMSAKKKSTAPYPIKAFHEKPNKQLAENYITQKDMFWNMGVFAAQASVFVQEFKIHAPEISNAMDQFINESKEYKDIPSISVDYAIMEKSKNTVIFPGTFQWHDIGNLHTFLKIQAQYDTTFIPSISLKAKNNMISSKKKVVICIGVENLCIIETDNVLLIAHQDNVEEVKTILQELKKQNVHEVL